ncbi:hypothetical protein EO238_26030, partial [Citrobacter sp. AAK_AS5]
TVFSSLTPWQRCQLARHPDRPYTQFYLNNVFTEFTELHGDRRFADDAAIVAGFAFFDGEPRSADVVAASDGALRRLGPAGFEEFSARQPG